MQEQYKVEILPTAWEDLKKIEDYYLLQFGVESAMKVTEQVLDSIERLENFPDSGSLTPDKWLNKQGYRMVISERYVSIYRQIEKQFMCTILQIHRQNIQSCFRDGKEVVR